MSVREGGLARGAPHDHTHHGWAMGPNAQKGKYPGVLGGAEGEGAR